MKKAPNKYIGMRVTPTEMMKLQVLMQLFQRNTVSDMFRFLIANGEKILSANNSVELK